MAWSLVKHGDIFTLLRTNILLRTKPSIKTFKKGTHFDDHSTVTN